MLEKTKENQSSGNTKKVHLLSMQARSQGVAWGGKCYPRSIACQLFATPRNCCALSYSCIIVVAVVAKEMSPKIVDKLNLGVCDIPESSIVSCTQLSIGLRQYIV